MKNLHHPANVIFRREALKLSAVTAVGVAFTFVSEGRSTAFAPPPIASSLPADSIGDLLPAGFPSARRSQIVGPNGTPVRIASVGLTGMNVVGGRLQLRGPFQGIPGHVAAMRAMGFNCVRVRLDRQDT